MKENYLEFSNQDLYRNLASSHPLPLHFQPWWLDAVCGHDQWGACIDLDGDGRLCGLMPYYTTRKMGLKVLRMPPFTDYLGIWIQYPVLPQKTERRYAFEHKVTTRLIDQLPRFHYCNLQCYPEVENWLPFYWKGFKQTTLYTYRLPGLRPHEQILAECKGAIRTDLKKSEGNIHITKGGDVATFYRLHQLTFEKQGLPLPYSLEQLRLLDRAATDRGRSDLYVAFSTGVEQPVAGLYVVRDENTAYFLLHGADPAYGASGAATALYWQAIRDFSLTHRQIDFCGSMLPGVEAFTRAFGGIRTPHHRIYKASGKWLYGLSWLLGKEY